MYVKGPHCLRHTAVIPVSEFVQSHVREMEPKNPWVISEHNVSGYKTTNPIHPETKEQNHHSSSLRAVKT